MRRKNTSPEKLYNKPGMYLKANAPVCQNLERQKNKFTSKKKKKTKNQKNCFDVINVVELQYLFIVKIAKLIICTSTVNYVFAIQRCRLFFQRTRCRVNIFLCEHQTTTSCVLDRIDL